MTANEQDWIADINGRIFFLQTEMADAMIRRRRRPRSLLLLLGEEIRLIHHAS